MNLWKSFTAIKLEGFILPLKTFSFYISQCKCVALCIQQCDTCEQTFFEKKKTHKKEKTISAL